MKTIIIMPIMIIMLSLAVSAAECSDGMTANIQGGSSFDCHFTECVGLTIDISIDPWQNMTPTATEYWLNPGCANVDPLPAQSTFYPNIIRWSCPCTDDYTFNLTTAVNSNGTYYITFNQTIIEYGPVFNSTIPNQTIQETGLLTIILSAYDNDTAQSGLSYSTDAASGSMTGNVYTWQTDYSSEGTYNLTFFVTDGIYTNNETITLIVTHKDEPSPPSDDGGNTGGGGGGGGGGGTYVPFEGRTGTGSTTPPKPTNPLAGAAGTEGIPGAGEEGGLGGITGGVIEENDITGNAVSEKAPGKGSWKAVGILFWLAALVMLILLIAGRKKKSEKADGNIE